MKFLFIFIEKYNENVFDDSLFSSRSHSHSTVQIMSYSLQLDSVTYNFERETQ